MHKLVILGAIVIIFAALAFIEVIGTPRFVKVIENKNITEPSFRKSLQEEVVIPPSIEKNCIGFLAPPEAMKTIMLIGAGWVRPIQGLSSGVK